MSTKNLKLDQGYDTFEVRHPNVCFTPNSDPAIHLDIELGLSNRLPQLLQHQGTALQLSR